MVVWHSWQNWPAVHYPQNGEHVAAPRFNYELSPARKDRHFVSLILHVVGLILFIKLAPLIPGPQIESRHASLTLLYSAPEPVEQKPPAPVIKIQPPPPKVLAALNPPKMVAPRMEPKVEAPRVEMQPKLDLVKAPPMEKPKLEQKVVTGSFATAEKVKPIESKKEIVAAEFSGASQAVTLNKPAREVQTGGFGDPNGIRGTSDKKGPATMPAVGAFNMPAGPGNGNGTGGARGAQGTVASAGFGDVAGGGNGVRNSPGSRGTVMTAGFTPAAAPQAAPKPHTEEKAHVTPVEIIYKPRPAYTDEARQLHVEGEVLVEVMFTAGGQLQVRRVVRGLGHGLDESALRAAQQIRFRPAQRDGAPYDSAALVHIVFELAE
jgi:TonB family protein